MRNDQELRSVVTWVTDRKQLKEVIKKKRDLCNYLHCLFSLFKVESFGLVSVTDREIHMITVSKV